MENKNSIFGIVPDDWNVQNVGDVFELSQGLQISKKYRRSKIEKGYIPLLKITDLPTGNFSEYVTDIKENYIATENDIIYTRTGIVGEVYTNYHGCVHNNCFKVNFDKEEFDKSFVYYYLNSPIVKKYCNSVAGGSVQKDLTHGAFKSWDIGYPSLSEQQKIGKILKSLDDKIELNNQMNQTLEEMAQSLFKEWFVDFNFPNEEGVPYKDNGGEMVESELGDIPKGWRIEELGEVCKLSAGGDKPKKVSKEKTKEFNVPIFSNSITEKGLYGFTDKAKIIEKSVTISARGTIGFVCLRTFPYTPIVRLVSITPNSQILTSEYLYYMFKRINFNSTGTTQQQLTVPQIKKDKILIPNGKILKKFTFTVEKLITHSEENQLENETLIKIRDLLLPKLMNGEIRV